MMECTGWIKFALAGVVLISPASLRGQVQSVTRAADLIGTWRYKETGLVKWDSATGQMFPTIHELVMTFGANGTFDLTSSMQKPDEIMALGNILPGKSRWSLAGDTLTIKQPLDTIVMAGIRNKYTGGQILGSEPRDAYGDTIWMKRPPGVEQRQWTLSSPAPGKLLTMWWLSPGMFPLELWRVDPTKPLPLLIPQPPTVLPADLVGTWVAKTGNGADTITFREDRTWAATEHCVENVGGNIPSSQAANTGKWYVGPENTLLLIDRLHRRVCGDYRGWRDYKFKLEGRRIMSYNPYLYYDRIAP